MGGGGGGGGKKGMRVRGGVGGVRMGQDKGVGKEGEGMQLRVGERRGIKGRRRLYSPC